MKVGNAHLHIYFLKGNESAGTPADFRDLKIIDLQKNRKKKNIFIAFSFCLNTARGCTLTRVQVYVDKSFRFTQIKKKRG